MNEHSPRRWKLDAVRVLALIGAAVVHGGWLISASDAWGTEELWRRDWWVFWDAGQRLFSGELDGLYDARPGGFPFLHPPPVIVLSGPLGGLGGAAAYAAIVLAQIAGLGASALALRRLRPAARPEEAGEQDVVWIGVLASAPWGIALVLGQPSALLLASWLSGLWAWRARRPFTAGLAFSLCSLKPPFVLAPLALMMIHRRRRALAGLAVGGTVAFALSLPAGLERWPAWVAAAARAVGELDAGALALWKQHTWLAFVRGLAPSEVAWVGWGLVAAPLGAGTLWRLRDLERRGALRAGAAMALATIALGPYAYFYDAVLLALPAAALWLERRRYPRAWLAGLSVVAGATFVAQHVAFFALQAGPAVGGALVTAWLTLEVLAPAAALPELRGAAGDEGVAMSGDVEVS